MSIYYSSVDNHLETTLKNKGVLLTNANGNSMYPFIKNNTKIVLKKTNDINLYDTILFKNYNQLILHRIIDINEKCYITMGDNCLTQERIDKDDVIAVLVGLYRNNKYIQISKQLNRKYYYLSCYMKPFIKIRNLFKKYEKNSN